MRLMTIIITGLALCVGCANSKGDHTMNTKSTSPAAQATTPAEAIAASLEGFATAFNAADVSAATGWAADDAIWVLTNGGRLEGAEAIDGFVAKAITGGAGGMALEPPAVQVLGEAAYATQRFGFDLKPGVRVTGQRVALLIKGTAPQRPWLVRRDVWLPDPGVENPEVTEALRSGLQALAQGINEGDAATLRGLYHANASVVLSNGAVFGGEQLPGFLNKTASSGITDMSFEPVSFALLGDDVAQSTTHFSVTVPRPGSSVTLQGERVTIWRRDGGRWVIELELSWPRA